MSFDYRKLLVAYMSHIMGREGSSQMEFPCPFDTGIDVIADDELQELKRLEVEADKELLRLDVLRRARLGLPPAV